MVASWPVSARAPQLLGVADVVPVGARRGHGTGPGGRAATKDASQRVVLGHGVRGNRRLRRVWLFTRALGYSMAACQSVAALSLPLLYVLASRRLTKSGAADRRRLGSPLIERI